MNESTLREFPQEVIASHALVIVAILAGEQPDIETFVQLAAETLSLDKLTTLQCRSVASIRESQQCWKSTLECFQKSAELWDRLPADGELLEGHRRLLQRLCNSASDRVIFYTEEGALRTSYCRRKDCE